MNDYIIQTKDARKAKIIENIKKYQGFVNYWVLAIEIEKDKLKSL